jgi:hypothetical protein
MAPNGLSRYEQQSEPVSPGELVVLNGRQSGARRALGVPVTFVGREQGCDIRLNVDGVAPFHCVLAAGPNEVTLRDLGSERGTFVNGQRVSAALLRDGDLLDVGPFRFRVLLPIATPQAAGNRDALSVQAAAVAAQQAALDEDEANLLERQLTLDQQEAQLAAHLDEQRQQLLEAAQRQKADRIALTQARADLERESEESRARSAAEEQRLADSAATIGRVRAEVQQQQAELGIQQVRFNTERELDSRLLQDGWHCLEQDQQRWRERRGREGSAARVRRLLLVDGARKLAAARTALFREKQAWETQRHGLECELHGLNTRVIHQRQWLQELVPHPVAVHSAAEAPPTATAGTAADLERLANLLGEQRIALVEQLERLARVEEAWHERRDALAGELETVAQRLAEQEEALARRERYVESSESRVQQAQEQLEQLRRETTAAQVRFQVQRQAWESERDHIQAEARRLGEIARFQLDAFGELRRQWNGKRRRETEALRVERQGIEQLRQELGRAREELARQTQQFDEQRRVMVEQALAARDRPGEVGMEQLRRRWLAQNAMVLRTLKQQRVALKKELGALIEMRRDLSAKADQMTAAQIDLQEKATALEHREAILDANEVHLDQQMKSGEGQRRHTERRLALLQEQTEHLARALIPDDGATALERAA